MSEDMQLVAFKLGNEEYAVSILCVQEIIRWSRITRVPKAPAFCKGVINLRGTVIPVIDSHLRFNMGEQEITDTSRIIIFKLEDAAIGLTVDTVTEVVTLTADQIERPQDAKTVDNEYINGIGKIGDRLLIILDLAKVLDLGIQQMKE